MTVTDVPGMAGNGYVAFHRPSIKEEDIHAVERALTSGWLTYGPLCQEFEATFADHVEASHAVALSSGTAALHLALVALRIGVRDEVITTPMTFCACAHVIEHVGASPVFADIDPVTMQIDPAEIERVMRPRTSAIIAVDFGGHPCQVEEITKMARDRNVAVIEDAAHSLGASVGGRPVGSIADVTAFSFYATKNITTGEGGMLTTQDGEIADRVERPRLHGIERDAWRRYRREGNWRYGVSEADFKANMSDVQAGLGLSQLRGEPARVERARRRVPVATFHVCGAEQPPYENGEFDVVIVSTVFSSILDDRSAQTVAREITRVLACMGVILCYDMRYPNPRNPHTRAIGLRELRWLFPGAELRAVPVTLLPPLARGLGALARSAYRALYAIPMLRSHYLTEIRRGRLVASPERGSGIHEKSRSPRNSR